jgi:hypothetical protein
MENEVHDMSRVDSFMASRRRAMFFHSVWKPMMAGAVGAAIISATIIGTMWVASPKLHFNEIEVPRIVQRDVEVDHVVPKDVEVPHIVTKDVEVPNIILKDVTVPAPAPTKPVADLGPQLGPDSPYAAKTPEEKKFVAQPEYKTAELRGRIVKSRDGRSLSFEDGKDFSPAKWDPATGKSVDNPARADETDQFIGDLGMCTPVKEHPEMVTCVALHNGVEEIIRQKDITPASTADAGATAPTTPYCAEKTESGMPILVPNCQPRPKTGLGGML